MKTEPKSLSGNRPVRESTRFNPKSDFSVANRAITISRQLELVAPVVIAFLVAAHGTRTALAPDRKPLHAFFQPRCTQPSMFT
jgi:hypothetical protein